MRQEQAIAGDAALLTQHVESPQRSSTAWISRPLPFLRTPSAWRQWARRSAASIVGDTAQRALAELRS